jgi:hypothetical protein
MDLSLHQLAINGDLIILEQKLKSLELIEDKDLLKPALLKRYNNYKSSIGKVWTRFESL